MRAFWALVMLPLIVGPVHAKDRGPIVIDHTLMMDCSAPVKDPEDPSCVMIDHPRNWKYLKRKFVAAPAKGRGPIVVGEDNDPVIDCSAPVTARTCVVVDHPRNWKYLKRESRKDRKCGEEINGEIIKCE
jgi:hypothetical protein